MQPARVQYPFETGSEVLRVLAGFESTWNWNKGVHASKPQKKTPQNEETGAFQVSWDGIGNDKSLEDFVQTKFGKTDEQTFITRMKTDHKVAIEYAARLLRVTVRANGPVKRPEINSELSRAAVSEFELFLIEDWGDFPLPPRDTRFA